MMVLFLVRVCPLQLLVTTESKYLCTDRTAPSAGGRRSVSIGGNGKTGKMADPLSFFC
jgi:hypothetical protein